MRALSICLIALVLVACGSRPPLSREDQAFHAWILEQRARPDAG